MRFLQFILLFLISLSSFDNVFAQERARRWHFPQRLWNVEQSEVHFQLVNNLVVVSMSINNSADLNFIVDTGVANTLLFRGPSNADLVMKSDEIVYLTGLGNGDPVMAFSTVAEIARLGDLEAENLPLMVLDADIFNLSEHMGMEIHGLIGYDLLSDVITEFDYSTKKMVFYSPEFFEIKSKKLQRHPKWKKAEIILVNKKPYVSAHVKHALNGSSVPVNLLIDSGMSGALALFKSTSEAIYLPKTTIRTTVGLGLSGHIQGYLGRVASFTLAGIDFDQPVVSYPDSADVKMAFRNLERNGSLGAEILKRTKIIFDYRRSHFLIRPLAGYEKPFAYNELGIEISAPIPNLPMYKISYVREDSKAYWSNIKSGDFLTHINMKPVDKMDMNMVLTKLHTSSKQLLLLGIQRDSVKQTVEIQLENELVVDMISEEEERDPVQP